MSFYILKILEICIDVEQQNFKYNGKIMFIIIWCGWISYGIREKVFDQVVWVFQNRV